MKLYMTKNSVDPSKAVILDDMMLTKDMPTTAGSKMLEGYMSLFDAEAVTRLTAAGYEIAGKANVGEFGADLLGETTYFEACTEGVLTDASAEIVKAGEAKAAVGLDVNGAPRRAAAQSGLVYVKPTYGTVSRYGTIPVACSGETVGVMARTADDCKEVLEAIVGHDDKDGTSLADDLCASVKAEGKLPAKVAVLKAFADKADAAKLDAFKAVLSANGVEVCEIDGSELLAAKAAWNILMSAELCNNVSRYDGIKFGYRTPNYKNIDELYTNSRTEAFGFLLKSLILFGSDNLSTENYMKKYDKALRVRRVMAETFDKIFGEYDAVLLPACSKAAYTAEDAKANPYMALEENLFTAPASITGLPAVIVGGVQLVGKAFTENNLFMIAKLYEKEGK